MAHRFNEWMLVVNDPINCIVHRIMNTLEGNFPIWIIPWFFWLRDPSDYCRDKIWVEFFLIWWREVSNFSCINYLLFWRLGAMGNWSHSLEWVCVSGGTTVWLVYWWRAPLYFSGPILLDQPPLSYLPQLNNYLRCQQTLPAGRSPHPYLGLCLSSASSQTPLVFLAYFMGVIMSCWRKHMIGDVPRTFLQCVVLSFFWLPYQQMDSAFLFWHWSLVWWVFLECLSRYFSHWSACLDGWVDLNTNWH